MKTIPLLATAAVLLFLVSRRSGTYSGKIVGPIGPGPDPSGASPYPPGSVVRVNVGDVSLEDLVKAAGGVGNAASVTEVAIRPDRVTDTMITGPWIALLRNGKFVKPETFTSSAVARNAVVVVVPSSTLGV